ncbi:hypothetical protein BJ741DRAFT_120179 [Chytriomyces cf. hyalinus JEL632]|nr:hypothetical protein BJ741DRAFT_120179 [Chytriomyces cf. hyalinus JEL632]
MEDFLIQYVPDTWPQLTWSNTLLSALESLSSLSAFKVSTTTSLEIQKSDLSLEERQALNTFLFLIDENDMTGKSNLCRHLDWPIIQRDSVLLFQFQRKVTYCAFAGRVHASNGVYAVLSTLTGFQARCAASRHIVDFLSLPTSLRDLAKRSLGPPVEPFAAEPVPAAAVVAVASDPKLESTTKVIRTQIPSMVPTNVLYNARPSTTASDGFVAYRTDGRCPKCNQFHAGKSCCVEVSKHGRKYSGRFDCPNENGGFFIISAKEAKTAPAYCERHRSVYRRGHSKSNVGRRYHSRLYQAAWNRDCLCANSRYSICSGAVSSR